MAFSTKQFDKIVEETLKSIVDKNIGLSNTNPGSVLRTLVEVFAENEDACNYYMEYIYDIMNIDNCNDDELDRAVKILGISREPAKPAVGTVTLYTGDQPAKYDIEIPYGFIVSTRPDKNGVVREFSINDGNCILHKGQTSVDATVVCNTPGMIYVPAGAICVLTKSLSGVHSVLNNNAINGGRDKEGNEEFKERIKNIRQTFGKCTNDAIQSAVNEVPGVTKAIVIDMYKGVGTSGIIIVSDTMPTPESVKAEVISVTNSVKASGINPVIVYATNKLVSIDITISVDESNYVDIVNAITNYCNSLDIGQTLIVKQLERKILNSLDKTVADNDDLDITTVKPPANVTAVSEEVIRAGDITINGKLMTGAVING